MKLSIITINRNNSHGLKKTCLSVAAQTFKEFEWIIIDGASKDNSVDIIKQHSNNLSYWISEPDSGAYNAMNKGIRKATGDYLLFLNSGDYLLYPWTLQEVIDEIKISKEADVYFCDAVLSTYQLLKYPLDIDFNFFKKAMINHQNCLIKRELFKDRLYDENYRISADWYFFLKESFDNNIIFHHIKTNIAIYDMNGISINNKKEARAERKSIFKKMNIGERKYLLWNILKMGKYLLPYGLYKLIQLLKK
ncbi:MAG: glycosyltransferase [Spirochaetaceae bacterium]|nr:glycosyltransferase [Spirochaetaceae bacterium]